MTEQKQSVEDIMKALVFLREEFIADLNEAHERRVTAETDIIERLETLLNKYLPEWEDIETP